MNDMPRCLAAGNHAERVGPVQRDARAAAHRLLLLATVLSIVAGCTSKRHCIDPMDCVTYPDSVYYGYYATCWAAFPPDWEGCPPILPPGQAPIEPVRPPEPREEIELETMPVPAARNYNRTRFADNNASPRSELKIKQPKAPLLNVEPADESGQTSAAPSPLQAPKIVEVVPPADELRTAEAPKPRAQRPMARPAPREPVPAAPVALSTRQSLKREVIETTDAERSGQHDPWQTTVPTERPSMTRPMKSQVQSDQGPALTPLGEKRASSPYRAGSILSVIPGFNSNEPRSAKEPTLDPQPPSIDDLPVEFSSRRHHGGWQTRPIEKKQPAPAVPEPAHVERARVATPIEVTPAEPSKSISSEERELSALKASFTSGSGDGIKTIRSR